MFDNVLISMAFILQSEPCSLKCSLEVFHVINEKHGVIDLVFLVEFLKETFREIQFSFIRLKCGHSYCESSNRMKYMTEICDALTLHSN